MRLIRILLLASILFIACGKKRDSAFCSSCTKGKLYPSRGCEGYPRFVSEAGDSVYLFNELTEEFKKDGLSVCVKYKKHKGITLGGCRVSDIKCIKNLED